MKVFLSLTAIDALNFSTVITSGGAVGSLACCKILKTRFTIESSIQPRRYDMSTAITCHCHHSLELLTSKMNGRNGVTKVRQKDSRQYHASCNSFSMEPLTIAKTSFDSLKACMLEDENCATAGQNHWKPEIPVATKKH